MKPVYLIPAGHHNWKIVDANGRRLATFYDTKTAVIRWLQHDCAADWVYCGLFEDMCPNPAQFEALARFARIYGRQWKRFLRENWEGIRIHGEPAHLHFYRQLRNDPAFGPKGLVKFKFGDKP